MKYGPHALTLILGLSLIAPAAPVHALAADVSVGVGVEASSSPATSGGTSADAGADISGSADSTAGDSSTDPMVTSGDEEPLRVKILHRDVMQTGASDAEIRATNAIDVTTSDSFTTYITALVRSDAKMDSVEIDGSSMDVRYRQDARFLGFIPASMMVAVAVDEQGDVTVTYPWYAFLMSASAKAEVVETELQSRVTSAISGMSAGMATTVDVSATGSIAIDTRTRALILQHIQETLSGEAQAAVS